MEHGQPPKSRDALLEAQVTELRAYWIGLRCEPPCTRLTHLPMKLVLAKCDGRLRLRDVIARLRCEHCRGRPAHAWLTDYPVDDSGYGGRVANWSVELAGHGSGLVKH